MGTSSNPNIDNLPFSDPDTDPVTGLPKDTVNDPVTITTTSGKKEQVTDPNIPAATPAASNTASTSTATGPDPGLTSTDPATRIDALYKQAGITDGGRGSGFADRAYWLEHPDQIMNGRLAADLAGTGSDQPTGTPGYVAWLNSGRKAPEAAIGNVLRNQYGGGFTPASVMVPPAAAPAAATDTSMRDALIAQLQQPGAAGVPAQTPLPYGASPNYMQGGGAGGVGPVD